ncbi:MAG: DEAD/DEAH box helicase, partial [Candidatus Latescibacterota bacterium]
MKGKAEDGSAGPLAEITLEDLPEKLRAAAARVGWTALTPVQAKAIPYVLAGRDVMVQSRTGTGKTGAFILPILHRVDPARAECQALVLVPTRELARQVLAVLVESQTAGPDPEGRVGAVTRLTEEIVALAGKTDSPAVCEKKTGDIRSIGAAQDRALARCRMASRRIAQLCRSAEGPG